MEDQQMGKYGLVAVKAAGFVNDGKEPREAWEIASCEVFLRGCSSQIKGCPRGAFLGLYNHQGKNAPYAKAALEYLKSHPNSSITVNRLWKIVMDGESKKHNGQMDVVLSLYLAGLI